MAEPPLPLASSLPPHNLRPPSVDMEQTDATWHHGWTVHRAGPQPASSPPRMALAISFIADGAKMLDKR